MVNMNFVKNIRINTPLMWNTLEYYHTTSTKHEGHHERIETVEEQEGRVGGLNLARREEVERVFLHSCFIKKKK